MTDRDLITEMLDALNLAEAVIMKLPNPASIQEFKWQREALVKINRAQRDAMAVIPTGRNLRVVS